MKVLFFTSPAEDYLADSLLHGFKVLFGADVIDFPKCEILYRDCPADAIAQVRGHGFTLYSGLLDDVPVDRFHIIDRFRRGKFDLVVFSSIWRQFGWFVQLYPWLDPQRTLIFDGEDTDAVYPAAGLWWRRPYYWSLPRAHRNFLYFKREWTSQTRFSILARALPPGVRKHLPSPRHLRRVAFAIPEEKIVAAPPMKIRDFPTHIVDEEVCARVPGSHTSYAFATEREYYADLQAARFGVTTKRAGWDCLRHYEIAANGAVPCFRDLDRKPSTCAPHGLDRTNCISYRSAADLQEQIARLSTADYAALQQGTLRWIREQTTTVQVRRVLTHLDDFRAS